MRTLHAHSSILGLALLATLAASSPALALTIHSLKGQHLQALYGTYAPRGDCKREPRIGVDDSGFAYSLHGRTLHSRTIERAVGYMGPEYTGSSEWFFPFPLNDVDFGRVLMTFNPDNRIGALVIEPDLGPGQSLSPLQAALVHGSPYARCRMHVAP